VVLCCLWPNASYRWELAYAVWTGIGAVGTFFIGIIVFSEPATITRFFFVGLIIAGILGLKLASMN
jgi:quaternary ammonium compound-resistance protein SugE